MKLRAYIFSILCLYFCHLHVHGQVSKVIGQMSPGSILQPASCSCSGTNGEQYTCKAGKEGLIFYKSAGTSKTIAPLKRSAPYPRLFMGMACDTSHSAYRGRIYVCWSDEKNGSNNSDVFLVYSDDKGDSWTEPVLVTYRPNHKPQFDPAIFVDDLGRVYLSYFDAQNFLHHGNDLYLARSTNGGLLFTYYQLDHLPPKTEPVNLGFFNSNKLPELHWGMRLKNKSLLEYSAAISDSLLDKLLLENAHSPVSHQKTVAFADKIEFPFTINEAQKVDAAITRPLEPGFEKIVLRDKKFKRGDHRLLIDTKKLGLEKGNYILTLYCKGQNSYAWILAE